MTLPFGSDNAERPDAEDVAARDREWVTRIRSGDAEAFEAMVRAYAGRLFGYAYNLVHARDVAEELVQDLFLRVWSQRETWEIHGSLLSYFFQATRNRAVDHLRHVRVEQRFRERAMQVEDASTLLTRTPPTDERARVSELAAAIDAAVAVLPERCREVFLLSREQQLSYREIADALHISVKTVEVHMGRALATLRATLAAWGR